MLFMDKVVESPLFTLAVAKAFEEADIDGKGEIDKIELALAMCQINWKLGKVFTNLGKPPTLPQVEAKLKEVDLDASGTLSLEEFTQFATAYFSQDVSATVPKAIMSAAITTVIIPGAAALMTPVLPLPIPGFVIKIVFGIGTFLTFFLNPLHVYFRHCYPSNILTFFLCQRKQPTKRCWLAKHDSPKRIRAYRSTTVATSLSLHRSTRQRH